MLAWKSLCTVCRIVPRGPSSLVFIARQNSAFPVVFRKKDLGMHRVAAKDPYDYRVLEPSYDLGYALRFLSDRNSRDREQKDNSVLQDLVEAREQPQTQLTVGAKGALLWFVISELFFGFSANRVYASALKKVKANAEVVQAVGEPIMGHGETTSRGRRRNVSYQEYLVDGENYMRVKFYLKGSKRKGTVHVDVKQAARGNFDYRYIFVELSPYETIIVLDNR